MRVVYVVSISLHILAAVIWIGGMAFLALVLIPVLRWPENRDIAARLIHATGVRFRLVGWVCLDLLLISGALNVAYRGFGWTDVASGRIFLGPFGRALGIKLSLVAAIILISALHDFVIGPRASVSGWEDATSPRARRLRRQASWLGRLNILLGLIVVGLGVILVRGWP